jgi:hypothetical protein
MPKSVGNCPTIPPVPTALERKKLLSSFHMYVCSHRPAAHPPAQLPTVAFGPPAHARAGFLVAGLPAHLNWCGVGRLCAAHLLQANAGPFIEKSF